MQLRTSISTTSLASFAKCYGLVCLSVILSTIVRYGLSSLLDKQVSYITYFPALVFSAWIGGWGGGIAAVALSTIAANYSFPVRSHISDNAGNTDQLLSPLIFIIVGLSISAMSSSQRKSRKEAQQAAEEARRSELAFAASEARYRRLLETANEGVLTVDAEDRIVYINARMAQMLGYEEEEMIGQPIYMILFPEDEASVRKRRSERRQGIQEQYEIKLRRKDETPVWALANVSILHEAEQYAGTFSLLTDITERKALEEEQARLAEREHRIAEQLQEALQPAIPHIVPGLALADYYQPALEEAGVGGDFSDVFALERCVTILVVGDLAGKGLAAATQVSTVRNMLRFALLNGRSIAGPITRLNRTLAENDLLTGFATLFVGRYDAKNRTLTYINCGQEAALIRRTRTDTVEALPATGPVLGMVEDSEFVEATVELDTDDILAIFTDGLTEAGPTRKELINEDGVAALFHGARLPNPSPHQSAQDVVAQLVMGIDAHARSGIRDDQCLLVGVVT